MLESSFLRDVRAETAQKVTLAMKREDIVEVLEARFPGTATPAIKERIAAQNDLGVLKNWLKLASTAPDFAAFVRDCR